MAVIKEEPPKYIIIPDTSVLWHQNKDVVVNPHFDKLWIEFSKSSTLQLLVPEVVKGELLFQQSTSAIKLMRKINTQMKQVSEIACHTYSHRITEKRIKKQIEGKFNKWLKAKKGNIIETPTDKIEWSSLIARSIWRVPPFEYDPQKKIEEKGFRDSLILETVKNYCQDSAENCNIVFLCNDSLLRDTTDNELFLDERFSSFDSIDHFKSYLDLTHEKLTKKFVQSLIKRANSKFFTKNNPDCLYYKNSIRDKIV